MGVWIWIMGLVLRGGRVGCCRAGVVGGYGGDDCMLIMPERRGRFRYGLFLLLAASSQEKKKSPDQEPK